MGALQAQEIATLLGDINRAQALSWHLTSNHYPPVPEFMVPVCEAAIDAYNEGEPDRLINLPEGVSYRGVISAPAIAIIEGHHLDAWLEDEE